MSKTVLVTGVAGFIAARTAQLLAEQGFQVVGIDNLNDYYDVSLKQYRLDQLHDKIIFQKIDIEDRQSIEVLFEKYDFEVVYNLAARAGVRYSVENPYIYYSTNTLGTLNLLETMVKNNVKKMVMASTSSLYAGQQTPFVETMAVNQPLSPYAASKKAAEVLAYSYHHLHQLDISIVRYFTVYGPAGRPDMSIFRFIQWIDQGTPITLYGDGEQSRDFTYIDDIAAGTILAAGKLDYEIINLDQIISKLEKMIGKKAVIENRAFHQADMPTTWADIHKARELLGWQPRIDLDDGLQRTVDWYYSIKGEYNFKLP